MKSAGLWESTTVLISADHPYRESEALDGKSDPRVPFLLKLAEAQIELSKLEDIGLTYIVGGRPDQIRVEPNPERLAVYGVTLAIYSLPVLQGILTYARQTMRGFIQGAARPLRLSAIECGGLLEENCSDLPAKLKLIRGGK